MYEINLEEILENNISRMISRTEQSYNSIEQMKEQPEWDACINAMKEACHQILELAAENAKINWVENNVEMESDMDFSFRDNDGNWCKININEQSILNTIKQVE